MTVGRWMWWYDAIADWMIANPDGRLYDCAKELNKGAATISSIINTDMFKAHLAERKAAWAAKHDDALLARVRRVANLGLDGIAEHLEKKRDSVPLQRLNEVTMSALDRLGYSPAKAAVTNVQVNSSGATQVNFPAVTPLQLEEARAALRRVEEKKRDTEILNIVPIPVAAGLREIEDDTEDDLDAPLTISSE